MQVKKNNPFPSKKSGGDKPLKKEKTLTRIVYEALEDINDSCEIEYESSATLSSLRSSLRQFSLIYSGGIRRYKLRDKNNEKIVIYRVA